MTHSELVKALCKPGGTIRAEMNDIDAHLMHMIMGICGEAGELLDAVKKSIIYRQPLNLCNVIEELGDLEFYMEGLRQKLDITRKHCLDANIGKLATRYSNMLYTDQKAKERADKV